MFDSVSFLQKKRKGFSLAEILVSCAIIIALGGAASFGVGHVIDSGKYSSAKSGVSVVASALASYRNDTGNELPNSSGVGSDIEFLTKAVDGKGPWLTKDAVNDPWGEKYVYFCTAKSVGSPFAVVSKGKNKTLSLSAASFFAYDSTNDVVTLQNVTGKGDDVYVVIP